MSMNQRLVKIKPGDSDVRAVSIAEIYEVMSSGLSGKLPRRKSISLDFPEVINEEVLLQRKNIFVSVPAAMPRRGLCPK